MIIKRMIRSGPNRQIQRIGFWTFNAVVGINLIIFSHGIVKADTVSDAQQMLNQNAVSTRSLDLTQKTNSIMPLTVSTASITHSGVSGTASWDIDSTGKLTIHAGQLAAGKGNWSPYASSITSIYVDEGVMPYNEFATGEKTSNPIFSDLPNVTKIDVTNLDVSQTVTFGQMFEDDKKLQQIIGLDKWDTRNCTWMVGMFRNNSALISLDLSNFDTTKVTNMGSMFSYCSSLVSLNVSNFNTASVTSINSMFERVKGKIIGLNDFDTGKVESMASTFSGVDFTVIDPNDIKDWNISKVTSLSSTFASSKFNSLDLSKWDFSSVTDMSNMFSGDSNVSQVKDMATWDVSGVTNMAMMFSNVTDESLSFINDWDVSNVTSMAAMFMGCKNLTSLDLSKWNTSSLNSVKAMFQNCSLLNEDNLKGYQDLVDNKVTDMSYMFMGTGFETIDLSKYDTSNVTTFDSTFRAMTKLKKIIGNFDTSSVTTIASMLMGSSITNFDGLNIADWDLSKNTSLASTFNATKINDFDFLKNWNTSAVTSMASTFMRNTSTDVLPVGNWDVSKVTSFYYTFYGVNFSSIDFSNWDVSNATSMDSMFMSSNLKKIDLSKWNTSKVTNFYAFINSMKNLEFVDLSGLDTTNATNLDYFFGGNSNLWKVTLGPKSVLVKQSGTPSTIGARFPTPVAGTPIQDSDTTGSYKAISNKWQAVDPNSGGTDHAPVGDLMSADDIMDKFATTGNPVTTYVWQQQPKVNLEMSVPDLDFGTTSNASGVVSRKTKDFAVTVENKNYPEEAFDAKLSVALVKPLTDSFDSSKTLNDVLIFRNEQNTDNVLSNSPTEVYNGPINFGTNQLSWDDKHGLLLNMNNDRYAQNGHYSGTLEWELTNSL